MSINIINRIFRCKWNLQDSQTRRVDDFSSRTRHTVPGSARAVWLRRPRSRFRGAVNKCSKRFPTSQDFADAGADPPAYCTITVIGAPCEIPPDVAVIVRFTFPRATPLVLPQPANPNTLTRITAARTIANRALRIQLKEMSRCLLAAIKNNIRSETQIASG